MKKKEVIASACAKRIINYEGIINKTIALINKNSSEIKEKRNLKERLLKRKENNNSNISELELKSENAHRAWEFFSFCLITIGGGILAILTVLELFGYIPLSVFAILSFASYGLYYYKDMKYNVEIAELKRNMENDEELESAVDKQIAQLRRKIDKLEQIKLIAKSKADVVREVLNEIEKQIRLEEQQMIPQEQKDLQATKSIDQEQRDLQMRQTVVPKQVISSRKYGSIQQKNPNKELKISM